MPEHDDAIGALDGGEAMGDDDGGPALAQGLQCRLDMALGNRVERRGGFIEDLIRE